MQNKTKQTIIGSLVVVFILHGCGPDESAQPTAPEKPEVVPTGQSLPVKPVEPVEPVKPVKPVEKPEPAPIVTKAQIKPTGKALDTHRKQVMRFKVLLNDGRASVTAGKISRGISNYEKALAIDPNHPAVLGELGWAAYLQKDYIRAISATSQAMESARDPKHRGMLLYNLGRIAEDMGHNDEAVSYYVRSLSLRENDIVAKRLIELSPPSAQVKPLPAGVDQEAICREILDEWDCKASDNDEEGCKCTTTQSASAKTDQSGWIRGAAIFNISGMPESGGDGGRQLPGDKEPRRRIPPRDNGDQRLDPRSLRDKQRRPGS